MVREKDVCWEYADKLDGNKVRCKFCSRILNGGISRLKHHLSRVPSKGVNPCNKVRDDVAEKVRDIISTKEDIRETPAIARKPRLLETQTTSLGTTTNPTIKPTMSMEIISSLTTPISSSFSSLDEKENAEKNIALFFFENKLDFSVARSPSYQLMIEAIGKCGPRFTGPSAETLKTKWMERIKSEMNFGLKEIEKEWGRTGCTLIADTWTDNKSRALINFLVSSPSRTFFHKSVDASSYFKNVKCLSDLFNSIIQEIGPENVVQIIVDGALSYTGIANHIVQNYGNIFVSPCASQCINSILEDFCKIDWVNRCIIQAQTITRFIYNNTGLLELMKKFTDGMDVIRTGITKSVSDFLSMQALFNQRSRLKHMFLCPEYSNFTSINKPQSISCITTLEDNELWRAIEECIAVSEPFLRILREVADGKPAVGFVYELMMKAKESIRTYYIMDEGKCKTFLDIVDTKWHNQLHTPLHSAAAFLNPCIQYNPEVKFIPIIKEDFFNVLEKLLPTPELRRDITSQILLFTRASGMFGCNLAKEARDAVAPGEWWEQYGDSSPMLQKIGIRILSQVCSTSCFEKQWSTFQQIHSEKRNKIDKEELNDIIYLNYNLKLGRPKNNKLFDSDPIQLDDIDMTSEWVEEIDNSSPTQWLDRFGSAYDVSDLNTRHFSTTIFGANDFGL